MTATPPDNQTYCFCPVGHTEGEPPQNRILIEGFAFPIRSALVALCEADGLVVCERFNRPLGWTRPT